jgi:type I restriction enzyme S subunit
MSGSWPMAPLGEVPRHYREYIDAPEAKEYPKLSVKLYGRGVVLDAPADGTSLKMKRHQLAKAGQVILSEIWGKKGAIGLVPPEGAGALCTSHFFLFDIVRERLEPRYLKLIFTANYLEDQLDLEAKGTTGYAAVRPNHLLAATIPVPPLNEQRRIVARIEALAGRIAKAKRLREEAGEVSEAFLKAELRRVFTCNQDEPISSLESACAAIIDNLHSNPIYAENGVPCVRSPDVGWGKLNLQSALKTNEEEFMRRTVRGVPAVDDIVFVREGGGTGKAAIVQPGQRFSLGQRVMILTPDRSKVLPRFLLYQLLSPPLQEDQIVPLTKGSASPHLNIGAMRKFRLTIPPISKQRRIVAQLDTLQAKVEALRGLQTETAAELDALLPAVLDRAFKGEL